MRVILVILCLVLPHISMAMNTPMGPASDLGIISNNFYTVAGTQVWGTNEPVGTIVTWFRLDLQQFDPAYDATIASTTLSSSHRSFATRLKADGRMVMTANSGSDVYQRSFYFAERDNGSGVGFTNAWHCVAWGSDGATNYAWIDGVEAVSNALQISNLGSESWLGDWDTKCGIGGLNKDSASYDPAGRGHFEGVLDRVLIYPQR